MLTSKQIKERIDYAFNEYKIPESAERVILNEKFFRKFRSMYFQPSLAEYHHCCGNPSDETQEPWKYNCWIDYYDNGCWCRSEKEVWVLIEDVFRKCKEESEKNPIAFLYKGENENFVSLTIIGRHFDKRCSDYLIAAFYKSDFIDRYPKNKILLKDIIKYKEVDRK